MAIQKADPTKSYNTTDTYNPNATPFDAEDTMGPDSGPLVTFSVTKVYTMANKPAAASGNLAYIIWVNDAPLGEQLQFSDGTNWFVIDV